MRTAGNIAALGRASRSPAASPRSTPAAAAAPPAFPSPLALAPSAPFAPFSAPIRSPRGILAALSARRLLVAARSTARAPFRASFSGLAAPRRRPLAGAAGAAARTPTITTIARGRRFDRLAAVVDLGVDIEVLDGEVVVAELFERSLRGSLRKRRALFLLAPGLGERQSLGGIERWLVGSARRRGPRGRARARGRTQSALDLALLVSPAPLLAWRRFPLEDIDREPFSRRCPTSRSTAPTPSLALAPLSRSGASALLAAQDLLATRFPLAAGVSSTGTARLARCATASPAPFRSIPLLSFRTIAPASIPP